MDNMATIAENLQIIKDSTDVIKQAIIDKGGTISGDITTWADAINNIGGGGSTEPEYIFTGTTSKNGSYFNINGTLNKSPFPEFSTGLCKIVVMLLDEVSTPVVGSAFISQDVNEVYNITLNLGEYIEPPKDIHIPIFLLTYSKSTQVKFVQQT